MSRQVDNEPSIQIDFTPVKRTELLKQVRGAAKAKGLIWRLRRQGAQHEIWGLDGLEVPIPRHREINERLARAIMGDLAEKLGEAWWRKR